MKGKIFSSFITIFLAAFSLGGGVVAWFTTDDTPQVNTFSAGFLELSEPECSYSGGEWLSGESKPISFSLDNLGSKEAYLRVRPLVEYSGNKTVPDPIDWSLAPESMDSWTSGNDGWWYYGSVSAEELEINHTVEVVFLFTADPEFAGTADVYLEAEAVQVSENSLMQMWPENPWH